MNQAGKLFVFEGADGVGKSTAMSAAVAHIESLGLPCVRTKDPGGTTLGDAIREEMFRKFKIINMAPGVVDCLMLASHLQVTHDVILPSIKEGKIIVADRYWYSEAPYASVRRPHPPLPIMEAYQKMRGPTADILFLFLASEATIKERNASRPDADRQLTKSWDKIEDQVKVQKEFVRLYGDSPECVKVDADRSLEEVVEAVQHRIDYCLTKWRMI